MIQNPKWSHSHFWRREVWPGHLIPAFDHLIEFGVHQYTGIWTLTCNSNDLVIYIFNDILQKYFSEKIPYGKNYIH